MKILTMKALLWTSITEAGFITTIISIFFQFLGYSGFHIALFYIGLLFILAISIVNIRLFYENRKSYPYIEYVNGHDEGFDLLTKYVKSANESIWVTRFSKGSIIHEHDYFGQSTRRISGEGCKPILTYRRIMNIDSCDKAEMICTLIEKFGQNKNFFLRKTDLNFFFELLIIDSKHAFIMFHEPGSTGTINGALRLSNPEIVIKFREIYDKIWNDSNSRIIKEKSVLTEQEQNKMIMEYSALKEKMPC